MHLQGPGGGGTWGIMKKGTEKVPQSVGVDALIERNVTSLGFSHLPEYLYSLAGSDKTDRRKHFLAQ